MLRAQAFEGFFTLGPILLVAVVSILLRARASRRRKQREEAARGAPAGGPSASSAPARDASAQSVQGQGIQNQNLAVGGEEARDAQTTQASASTRTGRSGRSARAAQFPWQRESSEIYPKRSTKTPSARGATAVEPVVPQQPGGPQVTSRESYAYPPALALDRTKPEAAGGVGPRSAPVPQQVVRPSLESRMAVERMAPPKETQDLRQRMRAQDKLERPFTEPRVGKGPSISARLERLPPLKRAVIWSEILGPPGGRQ